jgi:hypothetical protein
VKLIPNKTDNSGDTLSAEEFNSLKNEIQDIILETGQELSLSTLDQLRKAVSVYSRALYCRDTSSIENIITLSRPASLQDAPAYYNGLTVLFDTANANTGATTVNLNSLGIKKIRTSSDTDLVGGEVLANNIYILTYNPAFDSADGAFVLHPIGANIQSLIHNATSKTTPIDNDEMAIADSASAFSLKKLTWANLKATLKAYFDTLYMGFSTQGIMIVEDQKPYNVQGGASIAGINTRTLNTVTTNTITGASLASNQVTLPAGTYRIEASAPALSIHAHRILLKNVTSASYIASGTKEHSDWAGYYATTSSKLTVVATFTATTILQLDHDIQSVRATYGLGGSTGALSNTMPSVYARMIITKIG